MTWADAYVLLDPDGSLTFTMPEPLSANVVWRHVGGRVLTAQAHRKASASCRLAFPRVRPIAGECAVDIAWHRSARRGDTDNRIKPVLDWLKGIAYADDKQVRRVSIERFDDNSRARVVVRVRPCTPMTPNEHRP